jgi:hypothetical protein
LYFFYLFLIVDAVRQALAGVQLRSGNVALFRDGVGGSGVALKKQIDLLLNN